MQNLKKKTDQTPLIQFQLFIFYKPACLQKKNSPTTIHPGILHGWAPFKQ